MIWRTTGFALALLTAGCANMHEGFEQSARNECQREVDALDRSRCLARVDDASQARKAENRH